MRATLLTAQKMADSIIHEAESKRDMMLSRAESDARARIGEMQRELAAEEERLRQGKLALARFVAASKDLCAKQLQFLDQIPDLPVELQAPVTEQTPPTQPIETQIYDTLEEELPPVCVAEDDPYEQQENPFGHEEAEQEEVPEEEPAQEVVHNVQLKELKFGRNYSGKNED